MPDPTDTSSLFRACPTHCPACHARLAPNATVCGHCGAACDRHVPFVQSWAKAADTPQQQFAWMQQMLDLWVGLGALACQTSVLSVENLTIDTRSRVCIERPIRDLPSPPRTRGNRPRSYSASDPRALVSLWQTLLVPADRKTEDRTKGTSDRAIGEALLELERTPNLNPARLRRVLEKYRQSPLHPSLFIAAPGVDLDKLDKLDGLDDLDDLDETAITGDTTLDARSVAIASPSPASTYIARAARTDIGRQRARNEDNFAVWERRDRQTTPRLDGEVVRGLYVLCDGMGGHASGDAASQLAAQTTIDFFQSHWQGGMPEVETIRDGVFAANRAVYEANQVDRAEGFGRMGTTLVALLLHDTQATIVNVGDSRLYRYTRSRGLEQLTIDGDFANALIRNGTPSSRAYRHPNAHQLTQAIGPYDEDALEPDIETLKIEEDSLFLLASDGLTDRGLLERQDADEFGAMLDPNADLDRAADDLIDLANRENGHDNITVILVRVLVEAPE